GVLDLHGEWTKVEVRDAEGFIGSSETSEKEVCAEEKLSSIYAERVMLEEYIRKASLEYPGDGNLFKDPISFNDDGNGDNGGDDDDGNG
ncbi:hypothetical protein Tco_0376358, partial [Tanacetum coccineum]